MDKDNIYSKSTTIKTTGFPKIIEDQIECKKTMSNGSGLH